MNLISITDRMEAMDGKSLKKVLLAATIGVPCVLKKASKIFCKLEL
jgi:hypothetical protein